MSKYKREHPLHPGPWMGSEDSEMEKKWPLLLRSLQCTGKSRYITSNDNIMWSCHHGDGPIAGAQDKKVVNYSWGVLMDIIMSPELELPG